MNEFHASLYVVTTLPVHNRTDFSPMAGIQLTRNAVTSLIKEHENRTKDQFRQRWRRTTRSWRRGW